MRFIIDPDCPKNTVYMINLATVDEGTRAKLMACETVELIDLIHGDLDPDDDELA